MREKLIELLNEAREICRRRNYDACEKCSGYGKSLECINHLTAEHLIANGVTVREKGEWEIRIDDYDCEYAMCSVCCSVFYDGENDTFDLRPNFCPDCGADMRGGHL